MSKMSDAGEYHCNIMFIGGFNNFVIADRAARFDHRRSTDFDRFQETVGKGKNASEATAQPCKSSPAL